MSTNDNKRLAGIKEGAGLEDSKINKEFVDFVQRWGGWLLMLGAAALGIVYAYQFLERQKAARVDAAFMDYESAARGTNPSPDTLTEVAASRQGIRSVGELATLQAADLYLRSAISGTQLYVNIVDIDSIQIRDQQSIYLYQAAQQALENENALNRDGTPKDADQLITDEQRADFLREAKSRYQSVVTSTADDNDKLVFKFSGLFGLASVAETAGDIPAAKQTLEQIRLLATEHSFEEYAASAQERIDSLDSLATLPTLFAKSDLPVPPPVVPERVIPETTIPETTIPETTIPEITGPSLLLPEFDPGLSGPLMPSTDPTTEPPAIPGVTPSPTPDPTAPPAGDVPATTPSEPPPGM